MTPIAPRYDIPVHPSLKVEVSPSAIQGPASAPSDSSTEIKPNSKSLLTQLNRAALEVWDTWLQEAAEKDAARGHSWVDQAVDGVQSWFLAKHPKELRADTARREQALYLAVKERVESGASATMLEAMGHLAEHGEPSVQERARYYLNTQGSKTFSKLLIVGLMELSKSTFSDPQKTLKFVDEVFKVLESQGGCHRTALSVYQLVDAISSHEEVLEETQRHLAAFQGKAGLLRSIQKEAYGINPLKVAVEIGLIGISGGIGNLAKAAYQARYAQALWGTLWGTLWGSPKVLAGSFKVLTGGFAVHSLSMGSALGSLHVAKAAITEDVNQLTPGKIGKIYLKDGLMIPVTHLFGIAGKALFAGSNPAQHGMGLVGISTSTQLYLTLMPEDAPMGGIHESIAADIVGYGTFYAGGKVAGGLSEGVKLPDLNRPEFKNLHVPIATMPMGGIPVAGGSPKAGGVKFTPEIREILGIEWARIPAGEFEMGSKDFSDSQPIRRVFVSEFMMMKNLVTNKQFEVYVAANQAKPYGLIWRNPKTGRDEVLARCGNECFKDSLALVFVDEKMVEAGSAITDSVAELMLVGQYPDVVNQFVERDSEGTPTYSPLSLQFRFARLVPKKRKFVEKFNYPQQPAVQVTWYEALGYAAWLDQQMRERGVPMRVSLPTEAQWEKAARGPEGFEYGTQTGELTEDLAHYDSDCPAHVGSKPANGYGCADMSGNAWHWVMDWYQDSYQGLPDKDPVGPAQGSLRGLRGGSWYGSIDFCFRAAYRKYGSPNDGDHLGIGFRVVAVVSQD